jgi:hypothetical protein
MGLSTKIISGLFATLQVISTGCISPAENANSTSKAASNSNANVIANTANDSIEELRSMVQVPFEPEDLTWRTVDAGQGKKRLIAVMLLTPEAFRTLSSKQSGSGEQVQVNVERWFPAELTTMADTSGEMTIAGRSYPANDFYQPPYNSGNIILIPETNYAILDLRSD